MDNYLLIGNGLNRCLPDGIPWGNLLKRIADEYGVSYNPDISMPLEFERIINEYLGREIDLANPNTIIMDAKRKIAQNINEVNLPEDALHRELMNVNLNGIITTNYDVILEKIYDDAYRYDGGVIKKYLFEKTATIGGKSFFHIHGIADCTSSLCLGYEHYMGMVEHLRSELNTKKNRVATEMQIKRILCNEEPAKGTWGELFYTANIAVLGLGLTECESDLWWLITHRASLYYSNYCHLRSTGKLSNTIVYYDVMDDIKKQDKAEEDKRIQSELSKRNKHMLLQNEHIEVKIVTLGRDCLTYKEAYKLIIEDLQKNGIAEG